VHEDQWQDTVSLAWRHGKDVAKEAIWGLARYKRRGQDLELEIG
jgi:hypothetical protein